MRGRVKPSEVLSFWLGHGEPWANVSMWYGGGPELDATLRERFGDAVAEAQAGGLTEWEETVEGRVALVILLDQFARNVYRDDPRSFDGDERAQRIATAAWKEGWAEGLPANQRHFLLMPFMHAEDRDLQRFGLAKNRELAEREPDDFAQLVPYFEDHGEIVERFGRFPDRNKLMGRPSTPEEAAFLEAESRPWFEKQ